MGADAPGRHARERRDRPRQVWRWRASWREAPRRAGSRRQFLGQPFRPLLPGRLQPQPIVAPGGGPESGRHGHQSDDRRRGKPSGLRTADHDAAWGRRNRLCGIRINVSHWGCRLRGRDRSSDHGVHIRRPRWLRNRRCHEASRARKLRNAGSNLHERRSPSPARNPQREHRRHDAGPLNAGPRRRTQPPVRQGLRGCRPPVPAQCASFTQSPIIQVQSIIRLGRICRSSLIR